MFGKYDRAVFKSIRVFAGGDTVILIIIAIIICGGRPL
jgi:hypothetical protein